MASDLITNGGSQLFPFFPQGQLRNFTVTSRDGRGLIRQSTETVLSDQVGASYDGLGSLLTANLRENLTQVATGLPAFYATNDTLTVDGLGNISFTVNKDSLRLTNGSSVSTTRSTATDIYTTIGRLNNHNDPTGGNTVYTYDGAGKEMDTGYPVQPYNINGGVYGDPNPFLGRVVYGPGLGIDQPLSVTRYDYRDNPNGTNSLAWPRFSWQVFRNYQGAAAYGLLTTGADPYPFVLGGGQTTCPLVGDQTQQRCVLRQWPLMRGAYNLNRGNVYFPAWYGSLIQGKRDGSGLEDRRNRLYDPQTGRFTQEDPIGLAGGLNTYGFASSDPVNLGDPFGLWSTRVHQFLLRLAFAGKISNTDLRALMRASRRQDAPVPGQAVRRSYAHSMAEPGESPAEARRRRDEFISHSIARARVLFLEGDRADALVELGSALHAVMDESSPFHVDNDGNPKEWGGILTIDAVTHAVREKLRSPSMEVSIQVMERMRAFYGQVFQTTIEP